MCVLLSGKQRLLQPGSDMIMRGIILLALISDLSPRRGRLPAPQTLQLPVPSTRLASTPKKQKHGQPGMKPTPTAHC